MARIQSSRPARFLRCRPTVESLEAREVPTLSPVPAGTGFPFSAICEIQVTFPDQKSYVGSGVLVDRFHVLTAGHLLYHAEDGGLVTSVQVIPELNGNQQPFGSAYGAYVRVDGTFAAYEKTHPGLTAPGERDVALITLNKTLGDTAGAMSFGYDNNDADFGPGSIYNTAGYPATGGYNGRQMEFSSGALQGLSGGGTALAYSQNSITVFAGQSGSPVWRYIPSTQSRVVYGVVSGGNGVSGFSTRITQSIFNELQSWRNADPLPASTFAAPAALSDGSAAAAAMPMAMADFGSMQADPTGMENLFLDPATGTTPPPDMGSDPTITPTTTPSVTTPPVTTRPVTTPPVLTLPTTPVITPPDAIVPISTVDATHKVTTPGHPTTHVLPHHLKHHAPVHHLPHHTQHR